jgi:hypothetical protein
MVGVVEVRIFSFNNVMFFVCFSIKI